MEIIEPKKRHGSVTAWLILVIISNAYNGIKYILFSDKALVDLGLDVSKGLIIIQGLLSLTMVYFAFMVFRWKKWGFWGMIGITVAESIISISMGLGTILSIAVGIGIIGILYGMLQIKKEEVSAWDNLE